MTLTPILSFIGPWQPLFIGPLFPSLFLLCWEVLPGLGSDLIPILLTVCYSSLVPIGDLFLISVKFAEMTLLSTLTVTLHLHENTSLHLQ